MIATPTTRYAEVVEVIDRTVAGFVGRYGGDYDTLRADANLAFMLAYNHRPAHRGGHQGGHPNWATGVRRWVWAVLFDEYRVRKQYRRANRAAFESPDELSRVPAPRHEFRLFEFLDGLSEDARTVVSLVVEAPAELAAVAEGKGGEPRNWRSSVRDYLRAAGWAPRRVAAAFTEVTEALG